MGDLTLKFLIGQSLFCLYTKMVKPKERRYLKVEAPFLDEISDLGIIKLLVLDTYDTLTMKENLEKAFFNITNDSTLGTV